MISSCRELEKASFISLKTDGYIQENVGPALGNLGSNPHSILRWWINRLRNYGKKQSETQNLLWVWTLILWIMSLVLYQWAIPTRWKLSSQSTIINLISGCCLGTFLNISKKVWLYDHTFVSLYKNNISTVQGIFFRCLHQKWLEVSIKFWNLNFADHTNEDS